MGLPRLVLALALMLAGCAAGPPRWVVVSQASPNPFVGLQQLYVEAVRFDGLMVGQKTEESYLAGKPAAEQAAWQADKADLSLRYIAALVKASPTLTFPSRPTPGTLIVRPTLTFIDPGLLAGAVAVPSLEQIRVQILSSDGAVEDEVTIRSAITASKLNPSAAIRLRQAAEDLGRVTADYIRKRGAPEAAP